MLMFLRATNLFLSLLLLGLFSQTSVAQYNAVYGLNFTNEGLRLAEMDLESGELTVISEQVLSGQGFSQGVADFDPISKSYFYIWGGGSNAKIYRVSAYDGEVISSSVIDDPNGSVIPFTNIAYNWLDDVIYGVSHEYGAGDLLKFVKVYPATGELTYINEEPIHYGSYSSGNSDIDPIHRKYYFVDGNNIHTVDLDDGTSTKQSIEFPEADSQQFFANLTYNYETRKLYGLHFISVPDPNIFDNDPYHSQLRLATIDPETGVVTVISEEPTSTDGFSMGDCDIDVANGRFFYVRQGAIYIVDIETGELLNIVEMDNESNAIAPLMNMVYDDLGNQLAPLEMNMGAEIRLQAGSSMELNAWVGDDVMYEWSDGLTGAARTITEAGDYSVIINRDGFTVEGTITVSTEEAVGIDSSVEEQLIVFPNPVSNRLSIDLGAAFSEAQMSYELIDASGKVVMTGQLMPNTSLDVSALPSGQYLLNVQGPAWSTQRSLQIQR